MAESQSFYLVLLDLGGSLNFPLGLNVALVLLSKFHSESSFNERLFCGSSQVPETWYRYWDDVMPSALNTKPSPEVFL